MTLNANISGQSLTYTRAYGTQEQPKNIRQASAKLHVLCGIPVRKNIMNTSTRPIDPAREVREARPFACSVVYDLRNYTGGNLWGPYMDDGRATVDWERIEAIMVIIEHNVKLYEIETRYVSLGCFLLSAFCVVFIPSNLWVG